ncbi:MAG: TetR/AcrR family transcriptional regulator [Chloroflexi bacterium]|nr:TetR/AcrR family transcriptional regulator [Chloroflexota bacterium]
MTDKKVDRRIQRTRQLLQDALITLILEKGYDKITVQDIIDEANVGRSTFYAHYLDKDDLMESSVEKLREELGQHLSSGSEDEAQHAMMPSLTLFQHTQQQHHLYKAMIGGRGIEIVVKAIREGLTAHARAYFEEAERAGKRFAVPMDILVTYLAGSLLTLLTWWLDNDMPYSPERMNEIFTQLVQGGIDAVIEAG